MTKRLIAAAGTLILSGVALGQPIIGDGYNAWRAQTPPPMDWWTILYFVVACAGAAAVGFKNARRTHLD